MACAAVVSMLTGCKEDTQPRLETPTEFVLNTPPLSENTYVLSADNGVELSMSQADYGVGIVPIYTAQVSLTKDFSDFRTLPESYTMARFTVPGESLALALCDMKGFTDPSNFDATPFPVFMRVVSSVNNAPVGENGTSPYTITSNIIELKSVAPYFAVKLPDTVWIIGAFPGWDVANDTAPLVETAPESGVYEGTYTIPAGSFQLRFYDQLGDWDSWSIGSQDDDAPVDITFADGVYTGPAYVSEGDKDKKGKGSWQVTDWQGGTVKFTLYMSDRKKASVKFEIVD